MQSLILTRFWFSGKILNKNPIDSKYFQLNPVLLIIHYTEFYFNCAIPTKMTFSFFFLKFQKNVFIVNWLLNHQRETSSGRFKP